MNLPNDISRCVGQSIPFGHTYTSECKTCARALQTASGPRTLWMGPVTFVETCPFKIEAGK